MFFLFSYNPYIAVIGDIKNSKRMDGRNEVQKKLNMILEDINIKYVQDIASKFMITLGDEFQGLLRCGNNVMNIISEIEARMYPVNLRFGIGVGEITTEINPDIPLGADGPAYYNARAAIEQLKSREKKRKSGETNILIVVDGENEKEVKLLNTILSLGTVVKSRWTERQREVIRDHIEHGENQLKAAERLGITQSNVNKNLTKADYYSYKEAMDTLSEALSEIRRREDV